MPIYEYNCSRCGGTFEVRQKFSDEPVAIHEGCGGKVKRIISAAALQFKGTGWYVTDYGKGGSSPAAIASHGKSEPNGGAKSEPKSPPKKDSKPSPAATTK